MGILNNTNNSNTNHNDKITKIIKVFLNFGNSLSGLKSAIRRDSFNVTLTLQTIYTTNANKTNFQDFITIENRVDIDSSQADNIVLELPNVSLRRPYKNLTSIVNSEIIRLDG